MAAATPPPPLLNPPDSPTTITVVATPSSPLQRDMLSPSNSPASPPISTHRALSPSAVVSRSLSVPASPPPPAANTTPSATVAMSTTLTSPTPVPSSSNNNTTPPTKKVLERNQACLGCRQRKRKCDGGKPNCGACERLERQCVYTHNAVTKIHSSSHYRENNHRPTSGPRPPTSHDAPPRSSSTPSLAVPTLHRPASNSGAGFTPVNADGGSRSDRQSPPAAPALSSRLSPRLTNGHANPNPRKRSFSSLTSSPGIGHIGGGGSIHHSYNPNHGYVELDATNFASNFLQASPFVGFSLIDPSAFSTLEDPAASDEVLELSDEGLPSQEIMQELFSLFFEKWHSILPCLYKKRVLSDIVDGPLTHPNTLTFAILALSGYLHHDPSIKAASHQWASQGKAFFDRAVAEGQFSMQTVQGGIYLCLRMFGMAQMSQMWIFLSSVWRMCLPLGFHQIDSNRSELFRGFLPEPRSELELEERRRTVWAVYILDRLASTSVPWSMCVVDSEFCVNFPAPEEVFQNGSMVNVDHMIIDPFPTSLDSLIPPTMGNASVPSRDAYQHLCKLAVLLGRILSHTRSPHSTDESHDLDCALTRFLFVIPKPYRSMIGVSPVELPTVLLLGCTMHACTVFLHNSDGAGEGEQRSVKAVENILTLIRNVSSSLDPDDDRVLGNPLLGPTLLLAARILCYRLWSQGGGAAGEGSAVLNNVEILLGALGRMEEGWPKLAGLMKTIIFEDAKRDPGVM